MDGIDFALARAQEERRKLEGAGDRFDGNDASIPASGDEEDPSAASPATSARRLAPYTVYAVDPPRSSADRLCPCAVRSRRIIDRLGRAISPERHDAFTAGEASPDPSVRTYADAMRDKLLQHHKEQLLLEIANVKGEEMRPVKQCDRRDGTAGGAEDGGSDWDEDAPDAAAHKKQRSRWNDDETPLGAEYLATPTTCEIAACGSTTPEHYRLLLLERDSEQRSRPLAADELDAMFPHNGYEIPRTSSFVPAHTQPGKEASCCNADASRHAVVCYSGGAITGSGLTHLYAIPVERC